MLVAILAGFAVAQHGADVMHVGPLAEQLANDIQKAGGLVTVADLAAAQPQVTLISEAVLPRCFADSFCYQ